MNEIKQQYNTLSMDKLNEVLDKVISNRTNKEWVAYVAGPNSQRWIKEFDDSITENLKAMEKKRVKESKDFGFLAFENNEGKTTAAHVWNVKKDNVNWK